MTEVFEKKSLRKGRDGWGDWRGVSASRGTVSSTPLISNDCISGSKKRKTEGETKKLVGGPYAAHRQPAHYLTHQRALLSTLVCRNASYSAAQGSARRWRGQQKHYVCVCVHTLHHAPLTLEFPLNNNLTLVVFKPVWRDLEHPKIWPRSLPYLDLQ